LQFNVFTLFFDVPLTLDFPPPAPVDPAFFFFIHFFTLPPMVSEDFPLLEKRPSFFSFLFSCSFSTGLLSFLCYILPRSSVLLPLGPSIGIILFLPLVTPSVISSSGTLSLTPTFRAFYLSELMGVHHQSSFLLYPRLPFSPFPITCILFFPPLNVSGGESFPQLQRSLSLLSGPLGFSLLHVYSKLRCHPHAGSGGKRRLPPYSSFFWFFRRWILQPLIDVPPLSPRPVVSTFPLPPFNLNQPPFFGRLVDLIGNLFSLAGGHSLLFLAKGPGLSVRRRT